jgi:tetratricopeptide (TPR) repeat protein
MRRTPLVVVVAVLTVLVGAIAPASASPSPVAQAPAPDATLQGRIARVRTALFSGTGRPGDLIAELQSILSADPEAAEAHLLLGLAYRSLGNDMLAEAIAELRQAIALDPALVTGRYYLAQAYLDLGRPERAREELETALQQTPGQMQFTTLLADAERRAGNPTRALELARQIPTTDPTAAQARYYAAMALLDLKRRPEAIAELERLVSAGVTPLEVTAALGTAYLDEGRVEDAVKMLAAATQAAPARPDLRLALARAHRLAGRLTDAEQHLAQVLPPGANREASAFYETVEADRHLETGLIRIAQKRDDEAAKELTAALALRPTHGPTHRHLAEVYLRQGQRAQAITHATAARDAGEVLPETLLSLVPARSTP